jgi:hypothetical protein
MRRGIARGARKHGITAPVRWLAAAAAIGLAGCREQAHPWDQGDAEAPPSPAAAAASATASAEPHLLPQPLEEPGEAGALPPDDDAGLPPDEPPAPPVRVGGPWVRCYGNFRPAGDPVKDVTRLSLLCGPENGMRRLSKAPFEGTAAEGAPPVTTSFEARRGECYRVFAVAEPSVGDLDVTVESSRGAPIAADHGEDAWPIVQPDRPFCPLGDDRLAVSVAARKGHGRFAAEIWVLRTAPKATARGQNHEAPD